MKYTIFFVFVSGSLMANNVLENLSQDFIREFGPVYDRKFSAAGQHEKLQEKCAPDEVSQIKEQTSKGFNLVRFFELNEQVTPECFDHLSKLMADL